MPTVGDVRARVRRLLTDRLGAVTVDRDGDFVIDRGSARVYVFVSDDTESRQAIVVVSSVTNWDVTPTPDVYRYVATRAHNIAFGALSVYERRDAKCNVNLHHSLLAATLDPDELVNAVAAVAAVADKIDDEVATRFGGKRSIEPGTAARKPVGDTRVR